MEYKLANIKSKNLQTLKDEINSGSKFIVFNYRIGLIGISLLRFSPAIFIKKDSEFENFKSKYNKLNLLFGPWLIFKGPFQTYNIYKSNTKGGLDVTKDIMLNLREEDLDNNRVQIKKIHNIFFKII